MYDLNTPIFTYAGALMPQRKCFTRRQHIAACVVGFAFGAVITAAAIL
jgi:hypothetical protein